VAPDTSFIKVEREGGLAWLILNRPDRLNAMNRPDHLTSRNPASAMLPGPILPRTTIGCHGTSTVS